VSKPISRWIRGRKYEDGGRAERLSGVRVAMAVMLTVQGAGVSSASPRPCAVVLEVSPSPRSDLLLVVSTPFLSGIFALAMWVIGRLTPDSRRDPRHRAVDPDPTRVGARGRPDVHLFACRPDARRAAVSVHGDRGVGYVALAAAHGVGGPSGCSRSRAAVPPRDFV